MIRCSFALMVGIALLAGCASSYDPPVATTMRTSDGRPVVTSTAAPVAASAGASTSAYRAGYGIIESISLVKAPVASASAGGTVAPAASGPYRITIRMDDGNTQTIVVDNRAFLVGDRVQILPDGRIIRA